MVSSNSQKTCLLRAEFKPNRIKNSSVKSDFKKYNELPSMFMPVLPFLFVWWGFEGDMLWEVLLKITGTSIKATLNNKKICYVVAQGSLRVS